VLGLQFWPRESGDETVSAKKSVSCVFHFGFVVVAAAAVAVAAGTVVTA